MFFQIIFSTFWSYESTSLIWMVFAVMTKIMNSIFDDESIVKYIEVKSFVHSYTFHSTFTYCWVKKGRRGATWKLTSTKPAASVSARPCYVSCEQRRLSYRPDGGANRGRLPHLALQQRYYWARRPDYFLGHSNYLLTESFWAKPLWFDQFYRRILLLACCKLCRKMALLVFKK